MICTECQMENIDGALFCEECGARLVASWAKELWTGSVSMVPKIYANGKVYHITLKRHDAAKGRLIGQAVL